MCDTSCIFICELQEKEKRQNTSIFHMNLLVFFAGKGAAPNGSAIVDKSVLDITKSSLLFTLDIPANKTYGYNQ